VLLSSGVGTRAVKETFVLPSAADRKHVWVLCDRDALWAASGSWQGAPQETSLICSATMAGLRGLTA